MQMTIQQGQYQRGMTVYGMMFVLIVIGFVATAAVKLGPSYSDNRVVASALQSTKEFYAGKDMMEVSDTEIKGKVLNNFQVNMVYGPPEKAVKIVRDKKKIIISANYEIRSNFIGNVDTVLVFNNEVNLGE